MSNYLLYGYRMIQNDNTLHDFARCVYENCLMETYIEDSYDRRDYILETAEKILDDDISRTDIDYEDLLYKYRNELGDLFYRMWDKDYTIPTIVFLGEGAQGFFNDIVYYYIALHYDEFASGK